VFDQDKIRREVEKGIEAKLAGLRCANHGSTPVVNFDKAGELQIRGCCNALIAAAHGRLGGGAA
jgi:hypothetical protein